MKSRFGPFEADLDSRELRKGGLRIKLHEQPFQVLEALLKRPGQIVTREELKHAIWPDNTFVDFDQSLNKAVNRLRTALSDTASHPRFVETLSRRGYRLLVPVENDETLSASSGIKSGNARAQPMSARRWWYMAGAISVVTAFAVLWLRPAPSRISSIVVIPFTNLSGSTEQDYFVDGITDAITMELADVPGLRVVSTTSARQYKATKKALPTIARELSVDAAIEGAILRTGDRIRMPLKLIDARFDRPLWTETYEVGLEEVARLQGEIVRLVASEVRIKLTPEKHRQLATRHIDPDALDAYLKGYSLAQKRTESALKESVRYYELAIRADPRYARAYVGLADAYTILVAYHLVPGREGYMKQSAAARKALEIDASIAEAHTLLGGVALYGEWNWPVAERHYRRALELGPNHATGHQRYALGLMWMGKFGDARSEIRRAQELDPMSTRFRLNEAEILYNARQYDEAIRYSERAIANDPNVFQLYVFLGLSYVAQGRYDEGIQALQKAIALEAGPEAKGKLGYGLGRAGRREEALDIVRELQAGLTKYPSAYDIATVYAGLGDKQNAFAWLDKSYQEHSRNMMYLQVTPVLDELRSDSRFSALLSRVNLPR